MKKKEKYTYKTEINADEYAKMISFFPKIGYWQFIKRDCIISLILSFIIMLFCNDSFIALSWFIMLQIAIMIVYKFNLKGIVKKAYNKYLEDKIISKNKVTEFYNDYLISSSDYITYKLKYSEIDKFIETDTNYYIGCGFRKIIVIIRKDDCSVELSNFIKEKFCNIEKKKSLSSHKNKNAVETFMNILFILSLLILFYVLYTLEDEGFKEKYYIVVAKVLFVIFSLILSFLFNKKGVKCTKNIVVSFVLLFFVILQSIVPLSLNIETDYSKINEYKEIVDAKLPQDGKLNIMEFNNVYEDKKNYVMLEAFYSKNQSKIIENSIKESKNWILKKDLSSNLKIFFSQSFISGENSYYSVYNKTNNEYNKVPDRSGEYEIYAIKYDFDDDVLEIDKFNYFYK